MQRMSVTIVDFMAVLVPGVTLLFAVLLAPWPDAWLMPLNESLRRVPLLSNEWAAAACWALAAYVLGFLLRLISIELMNRLTARRWVGSVKLQMTELGPSMVAAINDDTLVVALQKIAAARDRHGVGSCAPYFHYAKRIIRTQPELWVEAERLEAEVRLAAGLFVPFCAFIADGVARYLVLGVSPLLLIALGTIGAATIFVSFPERRIKEVFYDYLLALVVLRPPQKRGHGVIWQRKPRAAQPTADSLAFDPPTTSLDAIASTVEPSTVAKLMP
jgi:hypothetical protein